MKAGIYFYGLGTVLFGVLDLIWGQFEGSHQPVASVMGNMPAVQFFAYIAAGWMIAAGLAMLWNRTVRMGAAASGILYAIFFAFWVLRFGMAIHSIGWQPKVVFGFLFPGGQAVFLIAPAVILYVATTTEDLVSRKRAETAARWMLGLPPICFGLGHLMNVPVIARFVPHWVPFGSFWTVLTGIAFVLAGSAIVSGIRDVLAARLLMLMLFLFELMVEIPPVFVQPHSQNAWGGAVYNLTAMGACWIFVASVASRSHADQRQTSVAGNVATSHPDSAIA